MRLLLLSLLLAAASAHAQGTGTLAGTVRDAQTGETLPGANVRVEGTILGAATNADGVYRIGNVLAGTYSVTASFIGVQPQTIAGVTLRDGEARDLRFEINEGDFVGDYFGCGVLPLDPPLVARDPFSSRVVVAETLQAHAIRR